MSTAFWRAGLGRTRVTLLPGRCSALVELQERHTLVPVAVEGAAAAPELHDLVTSKLASIDWECAEVRCTHPEDCGITTNPKIPKTEDLKPTKST